MITLPDLCLTSRANRHWEFSGIDHPDISPDPWRYSQYAGTVTYDYNSRGFRDQEWPSQILDLQNSVWCLGDSFTVGLGSPLDHTWTRVLSQKINQRTINISMDGASNQWIARHACDILKVIEPKTMVIMWSYVHRREDLGRDRDEDRRVAYSKSSEQEDLEDLKQCWNRVNLSKRDTNVIHATIPGYRPMDIDPCKIWQDIRDPSWPVTMPENFGALPPDIQHEIQTVHHDCFVRLQYHDFFSNEFIEVPQLDFSRDGHHFDKITAHWFVDRIAPLV